MTRLGYVQAIREAVETRSNAVATIFEARQTRWDDMLDRAGRLAGGLRSLGLAPGDRVAVLAANSDLYMLLYLAIPWAGGVIAPLNARWTAAENGAALDDCTPTFAFVGGTVDAATTALFDERARTTVPIALEDLGRPGWRCLAELLTDEPVEDAGRGGGDLLGVFYTGGTTGRPKGVMLSHAGVVGNAMAMRELGLFPDRCRTLLVAPLFHLAAIAAMTMAMLAGGTTVVMPAFDADRALDLIAREGVSDALLVPTMIQMILDAETFDAAKLRSLERIMYGASPMPEATLDRAMAAAPHTDFFQCYGMTELSCTATLLPPAFHKDAHRQAGRHRGAGLPLRGVEILIADGLGAPVAQGEIGEVLVRGPGVMLGYWNQPEQTAKTLVDGWMRTGDGGRIDDHGVLYVVDRLKDMIVSGGENVYSVEVESVLAQHPGVARCAVIGVPDQRWGERVHAVVVPRPGVEVSTESLIEHCRGVIAGYKCPRSVEFTQTLPMSAAGKILKAELRAPHWKGRDRNVA